MPESDLALLRDAAVAAGRIALGHWGGPLAVREKPGGGGPVTEADLAVNRMLEARLRSARPDYGWLSEESADDPARLAARRCFVVDPIDGTRAFIAGERAFAVSLAVVADGQVTDAVVHLPAMDLTYNAAVPGPARLNDRTMARGDDDGDEAAARTVLAARPAMEPANWPGGVPRLRRAFRASLAWRLCLVAEGRFDAMVTLRDTWEWDVAAGSLIVAAAGARVSDRHGTPLRFNTAGAQVAGVVAGGAAVHDDMLARLGRTPAAGGGHTALS